MELEWDALDIVREILLIPDAFQQKLSAEKTPTLCNVIPGFSAMIKMWENLQIKHGAVYAGIIQEGINKLASFTSRIECVPAYTIAMSM